MTTMILDQGPSALLSAEVHLETQMTAFLVDRKAQRLTQGTIEYYRKKLAYFTRYCENQAIREVTEITPNDIREYLLSLEHTGHNPGGTHCCFHTLRTFLLWWENEYEPEDWKNPIRNVKAPRLERYLPPKLSATAIAVVSC